MSKGTNSHDPKAPESKSKNKRRKSSRTPISDEKVQHTVVLPELEEKLRLMTADQNEDRKRTSSSRRSHRRTSSQNSSEVFASAMNELEDKMDRIQPSETTTSRRRREASRRQSKRSSSSTASHEVRRHRSRTAPSTHADNERRGQHRTRISRSVQYIDSKSRVTSDPNEGDDETTVSSTSNSGSLPGLSTIDSELSTSGATPAVSPGAYCVSNLGQVSLPSSSLQGHSHGDREDEDSDIHTNSISTVAFRPISTVRSGGTSRSGTASIRSNTIRSTLRSVSEEQWWKPW
mmetsp:Transcript_3240/g.7574  ORF Transcript_3240/g.7574 Transcript_3240/m.7574 type:complete len:290 (+) Transcript_3240:181-1050(+)